jgi:hypothetical protein
MLKRPSSTIAMSTPISPFAKPLPPPRPMVVLLSATDLDSGVSNIAPLLAHQDLNQKPCPQQRFARNNTPRYHPYRAIESNKSQQRLSRDVSSLSSPDLSSDGGSSDDDCQPHRPSTSSQPVTSRITIPRPKGAGRKSLHELLKWEPVMLDAVKVRFHPFSPTVSHSASTRNASGFMSRRN